MPTGVRLQASALSQLPIRRRILVAGRQGQARGESPWEALTRPAPRPHSPCVPDTVPAMGGTSTRQKAARRQAADRRRWRGQGTQAARAGRGRALSRGEDDGGHSSLGVCAGCQHSLFCCTAVSSAPHCSTACTDKTVLCLTKCVMLQEGLRLLRACPHRALAGSRRPLGAPKSPHIVREGMQCHRVLQNPFVRGLPFKGHRVP